MFIIENSCLVFDIHLFQNLNNMGEIFSQRFQN